MPLFSTTFTPPPPLANLDVSSEEATAVLLTWDASTLPAGDFVAYHVARSVGGAAFVQLATLPNQSDTTYTDFAAPIGVALTYHVTQESLDDTSLPAEGSIELGQCEYWLVTPGAASSSFELPNVTDYESGWPMQSEQYEPLGRSRKLVEQGLLLGEEGSVGMLLTEADADVIDKLRAAMSGGATHLLLKTPHGEVIDVTLADLSRTRRQGDRQEVTFSFVQVV